MGSPMRPLLALTLLGLLLTPALALDWPFEDLWPRHHKKAQIDGKIKTIVLLVMENRSFDHMVGWLKRLNPEIDGLTGDESNSERAGDPNSPRVFVSDDAEYVDPDPGHSFQAIQEEVFGGMDAELKKQVGSKLWPTFLPPTFFSLSQSGITPIVAEFQPLSASTHLPSRPQ